MKFEVTHPKIWKKLSEKKMPMKNKIQIYEKLGGAYRLGKDEGEQVFNKMTELLRSRVNEGDENSPEETLAGLKEMAIGNLERIADYANMIENRMKEGQNLDSWMYSQLTIALENLNSVHDAMDGDDGKREPKLNEGFSKSEMDKVKAAVEAASSFMSVGSELKKIGMRYIFATSPMPIYVVQNGSSRLGIVNKKYATKPDFVVGDIAVGVMD